MIRELILSVTLQDCDVQTFRSGGPGGQHQNKTSSGVRIIHRASGARGESREERSQLHNKRTAFRRMTETGTFRIWLARETMTAEQKIALERKYAITDTNTLVETRDTGTWAPATL